MTTIYTHVYSIYLLQNAFFIRQTSHQAKFLIIDAFCIYLPVFSFLFVIVNFNDVCFLADSGRARIPPEFKFEQLLFLFQCINCVLFGDELTAKLLRWTFCMILRVGGFPT